MATTTIATELSLRPSMCERVHWQWHNPPHQKNLRSPIQKRKNFRGSGRVRGAQRYGNGRVEQKGDVWDGVGIRARTHDAAAACVGVMIAGVFWSAPGTAVSKSRQRGAAAAAQPMMHRNPIRAPGCRRCNCRCRPAHLRANRSITPTTFNRHSRVRGR